MPDVQCEIRVAFEILDATLDAFAGLGTADHADLIDSCGTLLYGSAQSQVEALLSGSVANPTIPVTSRGVPELNDCWTRVLDLVDDYNALGTGLELVPESGDPETMPRPHCAEWRYVGGVWMLVVNWGLALTSGGRTDTVYRVSDAAGVPHQVLAMGHAAISVPIEATP
jgi:hypothetical protein